MITLSLSLLDITSLTGSVIALSLSLSLSLSAGYHLFWFQSFCTLAPINNPTEISVFGQISFATPSKKFYLFTFSGTAISCSSTGNSCAWCKLLVALSTLVCPMILLPSDSQPQWSSVKPLHECLYCYSCFCSSDA